MQPAAIQQPAPESSRVNQGAGIELRMMKTVVLYPVHLSEASKEMLFSLVRGFGHVIRGDVGLVARHLSFAEFAERIAMVYDTGNPKVQEALNFLDRLHALATRKED